MAANDRLADSTPNWEGRKIILPLDLTDTRLWLQSTSLEHSDSYGGARGIYQYLINGGEGWSLTKTKIIISYAETYFESGVILC